MSAKKLKTKNTRTKKRVKKTRSKLKQAALDVFSEKSFDAATVEEITEKADVGKGTLYQHFEDKEQIVITLINESIEHLIEYIRSYKRPPKSLEKMLEHLFNAHYEFYMNAKEEFLLLFQGKLSLKLQSERPDELEEPYLRYLMEIENQISSYLSSKIKPVKVRRLACAVAGFIFGYFSFSMISMSANEIEMSIKPLRKVFIKSLRVFLEC
jgi:AcrR family transcriptional regulator